MASIKGCRSDFNDTYARKKAFEVYTTKIDLFCFSQFKRDSVLEHLKQQRQSLKQWQTH